MTLGIMQPYIFPYIGYFQLIKAVNRFVIYDDVNFINKGWINRNRILLSGTDHLFTIPLKEASQNKLINEVQLAADTSWKKKFLKTCQQSYQKAPNYSTVFPIIEEIVHLECDSIGGLATEALVRLCAYLSIKTEIIRTSSKYNNTNLKGAGRILDICHQENATHYINPVGGMELYDKEHFGKNGVKLEFIKSKELIYPQFKPAFVPWLSIIDVLMFNEMHRIDQFLDQYELI